MKITFVNELWFWRGPSPFHFVSVPQLQSARIKEISNQVTYGWGVIPVSATVGKTTWTTSLIPKDGLYLVPIKNDIRYGENLELGERVEVTIVIGK